MSLLSLLVRFLLAGCIAGVFAPMPLAADASNVSGGPNAISIITVFDNYAVDPGLAAAWGHASIVKTPSAVLLFDTGSDGQVLLANLRRMGIAPSEIDTVLISHAHGDHLGGLRDLLTEDRHTTVYIPGSFPDSVRSAISSSGARYHDVDGPMEIIPGVRTTGPMDTGIVEQALVVETAEGLVVMTGCAHPGIVEIVKKAKEIVPGRPVALVMGGFHLISASDTEISRIVRCFRDLGVRKVSPSHCTGDRARAQFQTEFGDDYIAGGVGNSLRFKWDKRGRQR